MELQRLEPAQSPRVLGGAPGQILQDFGVLRGVPGQILQDSGVLTSPAQGQVTLGCVPCSVPLQSVCQALNIISQAEKPHASLQRRAGFWQGDGLTQAGKEPALPRSWGGDLTPLVTSISPRRAHPAALAGDWR